MHELTMIDGIGMKGKEIITPFISQNQILEQLHNHIGIENTRLLVKESVYLVNLNTDIKNTMM